MLPRVQRGIGLGAPCAAWRGCCHNPVQLQGRRRHVTDGRWKGLWSSCSRMRTWFLGDIATGERPQ